MNHTAFFKGIQGNNIAPYYVFDGQEEYIKESALEALKKNLLPVGMEALNYTTLENPAADEIIAGGQTLPFMADKRLIVIKNPSLIMAGVKTKNEEEQLEALKGLLENFPPTTCMVFYVQGKADGRKKLSSFLKKNGAWVEFNSLSEAELTRWIIQTFKGWGKEITPSLAQEMAFVVGNDTMTLKEEIGKIAAFLGEEQEVTRQAIKQVATPSLECTVFEMVDALVSGKQGQTFKLQKALLQNGEEQLRILAMILRQYRILLFSKGMMAEKRHKEEVRTLLGIPSFAVDKALRQGSGYTLDELNESIRICTDAEYGVKSGRMNQEGILDWITVKLLAIKNKAI